MSDETIKVKITDIGKFMDVVVFDKRADLIQIVLGASVHSLKCDLKPTPNALSYAGSAMGREMVNERTREQVQADIDKLNPHLRNSKGR